MLELLEHGVNSSDFSLVIWGKHSSLPAGSLSLPENFRAQTDYSFSLNTRQKELLDVRCCRAWVREGCVFFSPQEELLSLSVGCVPINQRWTLDLSYSAIRLDCTELCASPDPIRGPAQQY